MKVCEHSAATVPALNDECGSCQCVDWRRLTNGYKRRDRGASRARGHGLQVPTAGPLAPPAGRNQDSELRRVLGQNKPRGEAPISRLGNQERSLPQNQEASFNILECGREGGRSCHPGLAATPACSESLPGRV